MLLRQSSYRQLQNNLRKRPGHSVPAAFDWKSLGIGDTHKTVRFSSTFRLKGFEGEHWAAKYETATTEEQVDNMLFDTSRRTSTQIRVAGLDLDPGQTQYVNINPGDLDDASISDRGGHIPRRQNFIRD